MTADMVMDLTGRVLNSPHDPATCGTCNLLHNLAVTTMRTVEAEMMSLAEDYYHAEALLAWADDGGTCQTT